MSKLEVVRKALYNPSVRHMGLNWVKTLSDADMVELFGVLLELSSTAHSDLSLCHEVVVNCYSKQWLIQNIEQYAKPILAKATYDEYACLLSLYNKIDRGLVDRLSAAALAAEDSNIIDTAQIFAAHLVNMLL